MLGHLLWVMIALLICNHVRMLKDISYNIDVERNMWVPQVCDYWFGSLCSISTSLALHESAGLTALCLGCPGPWQAPQAFLSRDGGCRLGNPIRDARGCPFSKPLLCILSWVNLTSAPIFQGSWEHLNQATCRVTYLYGDYQVRVTESNFSKPLVDWRDTAHVKSF